MSTESIPTGRTAAAAELDRLRGAVDAVLEAHMDACVARAPDDRLAQLVEGVRDSQGGGKRVRALLCCCGAAAADGDPHGDAVLAAAASLELLHSFAILRDDVVDGPERRRRPVHRRSAVPRQRGGQETAGAAEFGVRTAVLLGDACLVWSDELLHGRDLPPRAWAAVRPLVQAVRTELITGRYLDIAAEGELDEALERSWRVVRHKAGACAVARPMQIGAALAGAGPGLLESCAEFGFPLGEAFQLRDDLLGAFGDPAAPGRSVVDFRAGKATVLVGLAWQGATASQREQIRELHGDPELDEEGAARLRALLDDTGARRRCLELIEARAEVARQALARMRIPRQARDMLTELAERTTRWHR